MQVTPSMLWSVGLVLVVSGMLIATGLKKQPGLGILAVLVIIALALWLREQTLASLGFAPPETWWATVLLGLALGLATQLAGVAVIEPLSEKLTQTHHDHSVVEGVRGNWKLLLLSLLLVWIFVPVLEEGIYRGFLMTETANIIGGSPVALVLNVLFSSLVFGLSHGYQGRAGILSTGLVGILLGVIFIMSGFNLWTAIFTHGFIDTVGLVLIAARGDIYLRRKLWPTGPEIS